MKKAFTILNAVMIAATMTVCVCYYQFGGLELKGLTSFGFVLVSIVNLVYAVKSKVSSLKFPIALTVGLILCMAADIALELNFMAGAIIFAAGHIFYFVAYCCRAKFKAKDAVPIAVFFAFSAMIITLVPILDFGSLLMEIIGLVYAFIISSMTGKSISNFIRERGTVNALLMIGSTMFYFSDLMLLFYIFGGAPDITNALCLFNYYPAQCVLAYSIFAFAKNYQPVK